MPTKLLLDENLRGAAWHALMRVKLRMPKLDVLRVGDAIELPLGMRDEDILEWAAINQRVLVSVDFATMPRHFTERLAAGKVTAGIILIPGHRSLSASIEYLTLVAEFTEPREWIDRLQYANY